MNQLPKFSVEFTRNAKKTLWFWHIRNTSTGEVVESDKHGYSTKKKCDEACFFYLGDHYQMAID
jgi:hypothetical protein